MYIDQHNHVTPWSHDANQILDELYGGYAESGLLGIGLSDHYDIGNYTGDAEWVFDIEEYITTFAPLRRTLSEALQEATETGKFKPAFYQGLELGYLPPHVNRLAKISENKGFDFIILSLHEIDGKNPYSFYEEIFAAPQKQVYERYLELCLQGLNDIPKTSILGHYDFITRYNPRPQSEIRYWDYADHFDTLFKRMNEMEVSLEINTGTTRKFIKKEYSLANALPDSDIIKRYLDLGGKYISLTADSHEVHQQGRYITETLRYLYNQGVRNLTYFEKGEARTTPIR